MKILFTNSPLHFSHGHTFTQPDWQTLVLPHLAGIVGSGHNVRLVDNMNFSFWRSNNILAEVEAFLPDIVGFSVIASRDIFITLEVVKEVRQKYPKVILIAGGQAGTYYNQWLLEAGIDVVVHGEGEQTLPELIDILQRGQTDYSTIRGISFLQDGQVEQTEERPMLTSLDDCPMPRWDLMPLVKSRWFRGRFTGSIEMSRGCPFDCNFCAITAFWKRTYRPKSNDRIIAELKILKGQGRTHVYLADDNFAMTAAKHTELFQRMIDEKLDVKFFAQIRADTVAKNPDMIALAARAGLYGVLVGFDTYDKQTFDDVTKTTNEETNIRCSETLRKNKVAIFGTHIYGLPSQKRPIDFWHTFRMGRKYSDLFRMPHFSPLPFTKNYEQVVAVNPTNKNATADEKFKRDFRPRIGDEKHQKRMRRGYDIYTWLHNLSPSEVTQAMFHPDPMVRRFKRQGYVATSRHYLYRVLRRLKLTDI